MKNILSKLTNEELNRIKKKSFKKGEIIFAEGEKCSSIGIVVAGEIEISSMMIHGEKVIYNNLSINDIFGMNLIFASEQEYKGDVISLTDSVIYFISREDVIQLLMSNKNFLEEYMLIESDFAKSLNRRLKTFTIPSAEERILFYLESSGGKTKIKSVSDFATLLNLQRETVSRTLSKLQKENIVSFKDKVISLK